MLEYLHGRVARVDPDAAVVAVGAVGVRVEMPTGDLARIEGEATVYTVLTVRDDDIHLYGFLTERSRQLFRALTSVGGVGPKLALAILSFHSPEALERAIATGDADALALVSGVGKKTAGRIVLELRDKLEGAAEPSSPLAHPALSEVREALRGLGYSAAEVATVLADLPTDGDAPTLLRHALRALDGDGKVEAGR